MRNRSFSRSRWQALLASISSLRGALLVVTAIVGLLGAGLWLFRDVRGLVQEMGSAEGSLRVNVNTATREELESVPGIGPTRASQIIAGRPYKTVEELERITGIGPAQVQEWRPFLKIDGRNEKLR